MIEIIPKKKIKHAINGEFNITSLK